MSDEELTRASTNDRVEYELTRMRAVEEAKRRLRDEEVRRTWREPVVQSLDSWLASPPEKLEPRIEGLCYVGFNTTVAAQYKAGKTTLGINRTRSLVDGTAFLDRFAVRPVAGTVVYLNYEVSDSQFYEWLKANGIRNAARVIPVNLRGKGAYFQDDAWAEWFVKTLRSLDCEVLEFDPLSAGIRGNTSSEEVASDFLNRLDMVKAEAGVSDLFLTTHTGHLQNTDSTGRSSNERTSGSARFMGWPDCYWTYTKDPEGGRYLSAQGRDVEVDEFSLAYDPETHRLSVKDLGTSRANVAHRRKVDALIAHLDEHGPTGKSALKSVVTGNDKAKGELIDQLARDGLIKVTTVGRTQVCEIGPALEAARAIEANHSNTPIAPE